MHAAQLREVSGESVVLDYFGDKPQSLRAVSDQRATRAGLSFNYRSLRPAVPFLPEGLSPERPVMHKHFDAGSGPSGDGPSCAYDAHNPGWWKTIPQEYLSCETERNCVSARAGGEQLEVSCWSVTPSAK